MKIFRPLITIFAAMSVFLPARAIEPYRNTSLTPAERAADLCSRLTLEEKASLMMNSSPAIERLGIPAFEWWSEALHGVGRNGLATIFPSCIGMAASFDDSLIGEVFTAVSDEGRAKNTLARRQGKMGKYRGLSFWTPTINIFRDPRWGRGQETYGEDPYMNGRMGAVVVKSLQGPTDTKYRKLLACAKHFAVHSGPESTRHSLNLDNISPRDLWETYLPAFEVLVKDAGVREVMCAYQRLDGKACCGSDQLLQQILRDKWGYDGLVVSDCGAINDFYLPKRHGVAKDAPAASALAVLSGTDVECGQIYKNLPEAVRRGDIKESDIDVSLRRLLEARFSLGDFDPDSLVEWTRIPMSVVDCQKHRDLALQMAREQCVLLKNDGILPLRKDAKVMVMGPNAIDSTMQWGIYYGVPSHTVTVLQGIENIVGKVPYTRASTITALRESESIMGDMLAPDGSKGMLARYWNNSRMEGKPVATASYSSPIHLDNGGNTVFAPGVALTDFTATLNGSFNAPADEVLDIVLYNDDGLRIIVNGDTIHNRWKAEALNYRTIQLPVKKGQHYDIQVDYMALDNDNALNFDILRQRDVTVDEIVDRAKDVDVVIFVGGISPALEREQARVKEPGFSGGDRTSIELPKCQRDILAALHRAGKKVVLVNCSGSAVALEPESATCDAILQAWYPGQEGGTAVAEILYGDTNPSGKLPVTFYTDDSQVPADFEDYSMNFRTYRYLKSEPLYHFGHGLSYTSFDISKPSYKDGKVTVNVKNTGKTAGTEIVQVYIRRPDDINGPNKTLRGYERVTLAPGESRKVVIDMPRENFKVWDSASESMKVLPGEYILMAGNSSADRDLKSIKVKL